MAYNIVAGPYTATWNSLACGQSADGFRISHQFFKRLVTGDKFAEAPMDAVYRGAEMFANFRLIEYNAAAIATVMWPYGSFLTMGQVGRFDITGASAIAKSLILTAVAGTEAADSPASLTLTQAIIAEGFPVELLFAPDLREVPLRLRIYPSESGVFGSQT